MRLLTLVAVATLTAGIVHYQGYTRGQRRARRAGPDELLAERVRLAIGGAASGPVEVRCLKGIVTLRGSVRTRSERDLALAAALAVPGVGEVTNLIDTEEPIVEVGTLQSGIATEADVSRRG
jgi:hypothetical protein